MAEEQERIDEEAASLEYQLLAATTQQQTKELEEQRKLQQGSLLRRCYRELVEKLGTTTYAPTEIIGGVPMPILTVSDLCRSTHPIFAEDRELTPEDRKALMKIDEDDEVDQSWDDHDIRNAREVDPTVQRRYQAYRKKERRLGSKDRKRVAQEQFQKSSIEYHTDQMSGNKDPVRIPISRVIKEVEQGLSEADRRLQMLKVHVEIAMMGADVSQIQEMIQHGEEKVRTLHEQTGCAFLGNYGEHRKKIAGLNLGIDEEERLDEIKRLSDVRRMTYAEQAEYHQLINAWIKTIEKQHEEDRAVKEVRRKRQRKAEWLEQRNSIPKLTAEVYLDRDGCRIMDNFAAMDDPSSNGNMGECNTEIGIANMGHTDGYEGNEKDDSGTYNGQTTTAAIHDREMFKDPKRPFANPNRNLTFIPVLASKPGGTMSAKTYMQVDSGASCNLMTLEMATALVGAEHIDQTGQQFRIEGIGGHILPTLGTVTIELDMIGRDTNITDSIVMRPITVQTVFLVVKRSSVSLLIGANTMEYFGICAQPGLGSSVWGNRTWKTRMAIATVPYQAAVRE